MTVTQELASVVAAGVGVVSRLWIPTGLREDERARIAREHCGDHLVLLGPQRAVEVVPKRRCRVCRRGETSEPRCRCWDPEP